MNTENYEIVPLRHYGRWVSGAVVIFLLVLIVRAFVQGQIDWPVIGEFFMAPVLIKGLGNTIIITLLAMIMGIALGVIFAVMRLSDNPVTRWFAGFYIWIFRGTPIYLQLLIWFNLALVFPTVNLGFWEGRMVDIMTPFFAALLGLGINEGAYMTEIVRGGILSVDQGQLDAASSLGMTRLQAMKRIVLPQAMRVIIPPMGNEFIGLLKTSSMASAIAYTELLHRAQMIYFVNAKVMELLIVATGWYLIVVTILSSLQTVIENRFAKGQTRNSAPSLLRNVVRIMSARRGMAGGAR
ncbi:amino acid ABC transporter permease [Desulforhopalus singaporensis]|uniref:Glutamate/aspartate import permease protein GltK n=1 Tax=Desulforhopalus singaporensis TaxID=91360 RepID=A0A1H0RX05_9BACT|nr:amino acid ABC transporter permease [Desulforhopalus singaporensis]SDP33960.1 polar amino acid transport system permease protein [Desulforhopalus singaporensis]